MPNDWFSDTTHGTQLSIPGLMDSSVPDLLWQLVELDCLVSVGRTRDGGAVSITVTKDARYRREYFRTSEDAGDWLAAAVAAVGAERAAGITSAPTAPRSTRKATRAARSAT